MKFAVSALVLAMAVPFAAQADDFNSAGTWSVGAGVHHTDAQADRGVSISESTRLSVSGEYFVRDNLGVELFMAAPAKHHVRVGGFDLGSTKAFTPTLSVKYHFDKIGKYDLGKFSPYVGLGVAYVDYSKTRFAADTGLDGLSVRAKNEWAPAANLGVDYRLTDRSAIRADVRYIDVDPSFRVEGERVGRASHDPLSYGVHYVHQF